MWAARKTVAPGGDGIYDVTHGGVGGGFRSTPPHPCILRERLELVIAPLPLGHPSLPCVPSGSFSPRCTERPFALHHPQVI